MKDGLIRLTGEKDIFYDSNEKVYRYRMHCPTCGVLIKKCMCYNTLELLESDIENNSADFSCSHKCSLLHNKDNFIEQILNAMSILDITLDLKECLMKLSDEEIDEILMKEYGTAYCLIINDLSEVKTTVPFSYIKQLISSVYENGLFDIKREEKLSIIYILCNIKDVLFKYQIPYLPEIEDLTEEQAWKVMEFLLREEEDYLYPSGTTCVSVVSDNDERLFY